MTASTTSSTAEAPDNPPAESDEPPQRRQNPVQAQLHAHPTLGPLAVLIAAAVVFECVNTRFLASRASRSCCRRSRSSGCWPWGRA